MFAQAFVGGNPRRGERFGYREPHLAKTKVADFETIDDRVIAGRAVTGAGVPMRRRLFAAALLAAFLAGSPAGALAGPAGTAPDSAPATGQRAALQELPEVTIIGSSPITGAGIPVDLYPGNAQTIDARRAPAGTRSISGLMDAAVGSVNLNDTQGSAFQADVNYRGYAASPVLGTPQGLSVFMDGMRMNEPFGDVVSWDLVPMIAVANATVVPGANPVYGLNTLGGALTIVTKSGFAFPGASATVAGGSFGRRTFEAEAGGHGDRADYYVAVDLGSDQGWARDSATIVERFFAKVGYQDSRTDLDLTLQHVADRLGAAQLVAQSMLPQAAHGYSHPDVTQTRSDAINLGARRQTGTQDSVEGNVYLRVIRRDIGNSNIADPVTPGDPRQLATCRQRYGAACASNVVSGYTQDVYGLNAQFSSQAPIAGLAQYFSAGVNGEFGSTGFTQSSQDAVVNVALETVGVGDFTPQSRIGATNLGVGLYATDTLLLGRRASVTLSARWDRSRVDLAGGSVDGFGNGVRVDGAHRYQRLDPSLGGTFAIDGDVTLFANYGEGFRTPSAIELACADAAHPCAGVPSAFSADPPLRGVVARSGEVGARGALGADGRWRLAVFRSILENDILFNQSTLSTGYFSNVGTTRRQGIEGALEGRRRAVDYSVTTTLLDATYRSAFEVASGANAGSACPGAACVPVRAGDRIPGMPRLTAKLAAGFQATERLRSDVQLQVQGPTYARGDENNLATHGRIPGFLTARAGIDWRIDARFALNLAVTNLFDRRTAGFGMLAPNNLRGAAPENFWAVDPPRTLVLGLKAML